MATITPQYVVALFTDENARVDAEVSRIGALLLEQEPCAQGPKYYVKGAFRLPLPKNPDKAFMEKVAQKFRAAGWEAKLDNEFDMDTSRPVLVLNHASLQGLPGKSPDPFGML